MSNTAPPLPLPYGPPITLALARTVAEAAEREALRNNWPMAIAIVDSTGHLVLFQRLDQTQLASMDIAIAKAQSAVGFRRSTKVFEDMLAGGGVGLRALSLPGAMAVEGGELLVQDGKIIGAIGISGMRAVDDGQVAQAGVATLG
ncbi:MAG TPA: heme-binding protein [Flavobacteriales bacterium]|jgi:uncharacterized protein GlcG (DUF336 family)|nr:heme-binding protein [Flavobacteriales bacterium]